MHSRVTIIFLFFLFLLFGFSSSMAQTVWMVSDNPCNVNNYFQELWKEISESKYGEHLKYAKSIGEMKDAQISDIVIIFTCATDTMMASNNSVAVGRSFTKISELADKKPALNMLQTSTMIISKEKFLEALRQNRSEILAMLNVYYKPVQIRQAAPEQPKE